MYTFLRSQLLEVSNRCEVLLAKIAERDYPVDIQFHLDSVKEEVNGLQENLNQLIHDPDLDEPRLLRNYLASFKRCYEDYLRFEREHFLVLSRYNDQDAFLYHLLKAALSDTNYPQAPPLISATSSQYYDIALHNTPQLSTVFAPVCTCYFLLQVPDLFHELGHLIYHQNEELFIARFRDQLEEYVRRETVRAKEEELPVFETLFKSIGERWQRAWMIEHAANMIATWLVGPSFGWLHLHNCISGRDDIYAPCKYDEDWDHPSNESQMAGILAILRLQGLENDAKAIERTWSHYKGAFGAQIPPEEHRITYPLDLIVVLAENVKDGAMTMNLRPYIQQSEHTNIPTLLNEAWRRFHEEPEQFCSWEEKALKQLRSTMGIAKLNY